MKQMSRDVALLLLRLTGLGLAVDHGWGKVMAFASGDAAGFVSVVEKLGFPLPGVFAGAATLAEFAGGLLVAFGLFSRIAAFFAGFTMFVAAFIQNHFISHALATLSLLRISEETLQDWRPEAGMLYLTIFMAVFLMGPGRFSLDHFFFKKGRS